MTSLSLRYKAALSVLAIFAAVAGAGASEFDLLRLKWRDMLTQGTNASRTNPLYSNWIAEVESTAQSYLNSFDASVGRTNLFYGYGNLATDSSDITTTYEHLRAMALAYAVPGSAFETNAALLANIISGLDWMDAHYYNATSVVYDNWYDFEIAVPRALNDTVVLLYSRLSPAQIGNYMGAIDHFSPTPDSTSISSPVTGYNKVWKSLVVSLRGVIVQDSARIDLGRLALSDVFPNVTSGEGFYADGSFVFHDEIAYNTGYGVGLLDTMGSMMQLLQGSAWPMTDPAQTNVFRWVYDAYAPFIVNGSAMDMTSGRYPTRNGDNHERGHELLGAILRVAQVAPPADAAAIKAFVKATIQADTSLNFLNTQFPPYNVWANDILTDSNVVPRAEVTEHRQFPGMDRVVHRTPNWTFGLSMSSKRVANYESTRSENLHGWFTGEGMTYLYNNDLTHYAGNFWATVNPYRLAGTTVDTITRTNGSGNGYNSPNTQVGGASILGRYGVAAMHLNAYGDDTMSARNSWFMFDNEIVCVGNSIGSSFGRETIVENRRLGLYGGNPFSVNGVPKPTGPGWAETIAAASWAHLAGSSPGADIGYCFPTPTTVKALRESRSGRFYDINTTYGSKTPYTGNYLTLYLDHGSNGTSATYSYVLLPGLTATQVAAYAASPDIAVLQNNSKTTAVKENTLGVTAVNFWSDTSNFIAGVSSDRKAAVIFRNDGNVLDIGISEPTQINNAGMRVEFSTATLSVLSVDPAISVLQLAPTLKLLVDTSNKFGATLNAKFLLNASGQRPTVTLSTPMDGNLDAPATVSLTATGRDPDGTIARLDFYSGNTRIAQVFAPGSAATNLTVSNLAPDGYAFTVVAVDNAGLMATSAPVSIAVGIPRAAGQGTGLIGEYYRDSGDFRTLALTRTDTNIDFSWPDYLSHPIAEAPHFCARWMGKIQARRSGVHQFHAVTDEGGRLWIDGRMLIDDWDHHPAAVVEDTGSISLVAGRYYDIRMEYNEDVQPGLARLYWTQPGGIKEIVPQSQLYPADQGLKATYYYATNMTATYASWVRVDDAVNFLWGTNSPEPTILGLPFAARWIGKVKANAAGAYQFFTSSDDAVRLYVNGQLLINNWTPHALTEDSNTITLNTAGQYYDLTMEYFNLSGTGTAILSWQPPGGTKQVIPTSNLTPHQNNNPPILGSITNVAVTRGGSVGFTATATDPDGSSLIYSLDAGAPAGATIHPSSGIFGWTPSIAQPGGNYNLVLRVTDTGSPVMGDSKMFTITLIDINTPPSIPPIASQAAIPGTLLFLSVGASDSDLPAQILSYALVSGPAGAMIDSSGRFTWTPNQAQASSTNPVVIRVTDNGSPSLSATQSFTVVVSGVLCTDPQFPHYPRWKGDVVNGITAATNGVTISDWVLVGLFYAQLRSPTNDCQKAQADCARVTANGVTNWCGDGEIKLGDWAQAGRYATQLDPWIDMSDCPPVGGGFAPAGFVPAALPPPSPLAAFEAGTALRTLILTNGAIEQGQTSCLQLLMDAFGNENAVGFSLTYDTNRLTLMSAAPGVDAPSFFNVNNQSNGILSLAMSQASGETFAPGVRVLAQLCFHALDATHPVSTALRFGDQPVGREIVDPEVHLLASKYVDGTVVITHGNDSVFEAIGVQDGAGVKLRLIGQPGVTWELQGSSDLVHWDPITRATNVTGLIEFTESVATHSTQRFYRALKP